MRRSAALPLHETFRARQNALSLRRYRTVVRADDNGRGVYSGFGDGRQDVREQRASRDRMQHLGQRRTHAGALAGRKHDRKAGPIPSKATSAGALIEHAAEDANCAAIRRAVRQYEVKQMESAIFTIDSHGNPGAESRMLGAARHPSLSQRPSRHRQRRSPRKTTLTMQRLLRQAAWGCAAAAALFVAVISGRSDNGAQRAAEAFGYAQSSEVPKHQFDAEAAARQLAGAIRGLNEDRDRLTKRLAALERDMDDTTGSIKRRSTRSRQRPRPKIPPWPTDAPAVP